METNMKFLSQRGFSLMEVVIAIAIFAIGMLALASLQGSLTRSAADANLRTIAANIGEYTIEDIRGFGRIDTDPAGIIPAYADIKTTLPEKIMDGDGGTPLDGDISFIRTMTVTPYYYDLATDTFTETQPIGIAVSDFKLLEVTVAWGGEDADSQLTAVDFQLDEETSLSVDDLGTGSITLSAMISSISTQGSARASTQEDDNDFVPTVNYTPGQNPDIVSLTLGDNKFKESLTPEPEVIRADELVETRFDVITYSQTGGTSLFLRREEFIAVSCECQLKAAPGNAGDAGRRPALWVGDEYLEPEFIDKAYGVSANNTQSPFCDTCCQDHHDGGTGTYDIANDDGANVYSPFRAKADYMTGTFDGDHKHYKRDGSGNLSLASSVDDIYVEACRLVRKDGFFRVAQDFGLDSLNVFPYDYLDSEAEVGDYSGWLTTSVGTHTTDVVTNSYISADFAYFFQSPDFGNPSRTSFGDPALEGDLTVDYTELPTALNADFQQLRSRGVYVDYMIKDLRDTIACLRQNGDEITCRYNDVILDKTGSTNILEIIPFFEVQLTFLNRWTEAPSNLPVDTTNETLETGNVHSRGMASKEATAGSSIVDSKGHMGNLGFTDTDPIDLNYTSELMNNNIDVFLDNSGNPTLNGVIVTVIITSGVPGVQGTNVEIEASNATCDRTNDGFVCLVENGSTNASVKLLNYHKQNDNDIVACSYEATLPVTQGSDTSSRPFAVFDLDNAVDTIDYQISIERTACDGGGFGF